MNTALLTQARIFFQFFLRDLYTYGKRIHTYILNFIVIYPTTYIIAFGYIQAKSYFGAENYTQATIFFAGNIILLIISLTFELTITQLFDLEHNRVTDYYITILHPRLVIVHRILFSTVFAFIAMLPFFPLSSMLLGRNFDTTQTNWITLLWILFLTCFCCSCYHMAVTCALRRSSQIVHFWMRLNLPLITIGGFWAPWHTMNYYSPALGIITLINPLLYATEGIRQALIPDTLFFSIESCSLALIAFSGIFMVISWYLFKLKVDHI